MTQGPIWQRSSLTLKNDQIKRMKEFFVRNIQTPIVDSMLYDSGAFGVFVQGVPSGTSLGNIYLEYSITYKNPVFSEQAGVFIGNKLSS